MLRRDICSRRVPQVDRTLYALVFGESVMNDAVAVALFQTLLGFIGRSTFGASEVMEALGLFLAKFLGSTVVGVLLSALAALLLKNMRVEQPYLAIGTFVCTGYIGYALCEGIKLSGILCVFFTGFTLKHYAYYNVPKATRTSVSDVLKSAAFLAESSIYVYLGIAFFVDPSDYIRDYAFFAIVIMLCLAGRALNVFPLTLLANFFRENKVSFRFQVRRFSHLADSLFGVVLTRRRLYVP